MFVVDAMGMILGADRARSDKSVAANGESTGTFPGALSGCSGQRRDVALLLSGYSDEFSGADYGGRRQYDKADRVVQTKIRLHHWR